jgi:hypothetical protein
MNLINLMSVLKDYMLGLSFPEIPFEVGMGAFVGFIGFWVLLQFINKPLSEEERVMYFRKLRKIRNSKLRKIKTKDSKIEFKQEIVGVETSDFKYVSERPKSNMKKCKVSLSAGMIQASQQQDWEEYSCSSVDTSTLSIDNGANDDRLRGSSSDDYASSAVYTSGEEDETEGLLDEDNTVKKLSRFQKMGVSEEMLREEIRKVNELKSQGVSLDDIAELQKSDLQQVNLIKAFDWVLFIGLIIMGAWAANEMSDGDAGRVLAAMFPKETTALGLKDFLEGYSSRTNTGSAESAGGVVRRE